MRTTLERFLARDAAGTRGCRSARGHLPERVFLSHTMEAGATRPRAIRVPVQPGTSVKLGSLTLDATLDAPAFGRPVRAARRAARTRTWNGYSDRVTGYSGAVAFPKVTATYTW